MSPLSSVEAFDPETGTWVARAPIPIAMAGVQAGVVSGTIYLPGGYSGGAQSILRIYDPVADSWTTGAPLPEARNGSGVAAYNGKLYIIGGYDADFVFTNTVYEYDPVANSYVTKAPMPLPTINLAAATLGDRIYAVGGFDHYANYAYDPVADSWSEIADGLTYDFQGPGAFALDDELWVVAGSYGTEGYPPEQQVHIYTPASNSWRFGPTFNEPRFWRPAVGVLGDHAYVAGGYRYPGYPQQVPLASVEATPAVRCLFLPAVLFQN
jgi:N-acetylneuraminic acid mutarotase